MESKGELVIRKVDTVDKGADMLTKNASVDVVRLNNKLLGPV